MNVMKAIDLQPLNTLGVPSIADYYTKAGTAEEVCQALAWAKRNHISVYVLGGGSNTLLPDRVEGLVLQPALRAIETVESNADTYVVKAGAGENWHRFVQYCLQKKYYGLENLIAIPGRVGAAPIQNIGAYGVELCDVFEKLEAVDRRSGKIEFFDKAACEFGYRDSIFKNRWKNQFVILNVYFRVNRQANISDEYPSLKKALSGFKRNTVTPELVANAVTEIRRERIPAPEDIPNCGSFFKNPVVARELVESIRLMYPEIVCYDVDATYQKIAAGWLIETAGWKGRSAFDVNVHDQQALVLTNPKKMPMKNVLQLANAIRSNIKTRFGIELEIEPQVLSSNSTAS